MTPRAVAVVGTDTGVGKTAVAAALVRALRARGVDAVGMKPFSTGCRRTRAGLRSPDADALVAAARGAPAAYDDASPCRWAPPVSPLAAGATRADVARAAAALRRLRRTRGAVVVEGIGGALVPITPGVDLADLLARWRLPALVVGRLGLGTLNHVRLTVEALRRRRIRLEGLVLVATRPPRGDPSAATNPRLAATLARLPLLGVVPYGETARAERFIRWPARQRRS